MTNVCPTCGVENPAGARTCAACKGALSTEPREVRARRPTRSMPIPEDLGGDVSRAALERTTKTSLKGFAPPAPPAPSAEREGDREHETSATGIPRPAEEEPPPEVEAAAMPRPTTPHYLITSILGEPVELSPDRPTRIGRGEENEIVFMLEQVSRLHAEVRWDGSGYAIIDRGSMNGTFVNGQPVRRRRLQDNDRIEVGPFSLVYRTTTGGKKTPSEEDDIHRTARFQQGGFSGDIAEMPLPQVCGLLERLNKTGELVIVFGDGAKGTIYVRDGRPVHAELGLDQGVPAAQRLVQMKEGSFRFAAKPVQVQIPTISVGFDGLGTPSA